MCISHGQIVRGVAIRLRHCSSEAAPIGHFAGIRGMVRRFAIVFATACVLSNSIAHAGEQLRLAVNELDAVGVDAQTARVVSDHLRSKLIETRRFIIPERDKMEEILAEQAVGLTVGECYSQECAIELGRLLQANKMVVGTVSRLNDTYNISIRFLDLESGAAEFSAEEMVQNTDDLYHAAERLAARIIAFVPPRGVVTVVNDGQIIIDLGRADGVVEGMRFRIMRVVERVPGYPEEELVAMAEVSKAQEMWSRLAISREQSGGLRRSAAAAVGDIAVGPQTVSVEELPQYAFLMVYSHPIGAEVYVDNLFRGRTKDRGLEIQLTAGRHQVRLDAPAHEAEERTVELQPSQRVPFNATLQPVLPQRVFNMPFTSLSYIRQQPTDDRFRSQIETESMQGVQIAFGRVYSVWTTEIGMSWTMANMAPDRGYGVDEVHRLGGYAQLGLALPLGMLVPYAAVGYEIGQLMFNEQNVFDGAETIGAAGKIRQDGWQWAVGIHLRRWLNLSYRATVNRTNTDFKVFSVGVNLSGF